MNSCIYISLPKYKELSLCSLVLIFQLCYLEIYSQQNTYKDDIYTTIHVNGTANVTVTSDIKEIKNLSPEIRTKRTLSGTYNMNVSFNGKIQAQKDQNSITIFSDQSKLRGSGTKSGKLFTVDEKWDDGANEPCSKYSITNSISTFNYKIEPEGLDVSLNFDFESGASAVNFNSSFIEEGGTTNISGNCIPSTTLNSVAPSIINPFQNFALINQTKYDHDKLSNFDAVIPQENTLDNFLLLFKNRIAQIITNQKHNNFRVTYSKSFTIKVENGTYQVTKTFNAEFKVGPSKYEAEIICITPQGYENWIPLGPIVDETAIVNTSSTEQTKEHGNTISFQVKVYEKGTRNEVGPPYVTKFYLKNVSQYPGYSMNFPSSNPDTHPDLKFFEIPGTSSHFKTFNDNEAFTKEDFGDQPVTVMSYDYGSYGIIQAEVVINGVTISAKSVFDKKDFISIPLCNGKSFIAENWKRQMNSTSLLDEDDNEAIYNGLGDHHGDGLTVFEEYRGFIENKKHIRTNPKKKDLMICNQFKGGFDKNGIDTLKIRVEDGINMFRGVTGINVHSDFLPEEFGRNANVAIEGVDRDKCINFNFHAKTHSVDQHGVWINKNPEKLGYCQAITKIDNGELGTPKRFKYIDICVDFDPSNEGWGVVAGTIDAMGNFNVDPTGTAKILTDVFARVIAHEILHCCNVHHHGEEGDYGNCTFFSGSVYPFLNLDITKIYFFQGKGTPDLTTDVFEAELYEENNPNVKILGTDPRFNKPSVKYVAGQGGNHSGVEDCLMRYDIARIFLRNDKMYLIDKKKGFYSELSGIKLCDSKIGTGINNKNKIPFPRFGDASIGNCKKQFCINDKYH